VQKTKTKKTNMIAILNKYKIFKQKIIKKKYIKFFYLNSIYCLRYGGTALPTMPLSIGTAIR